MKFWLPIIGEQVEQARDIARLAEETGFEGVLLADHVVVPDGFKSIHPSGQEMVTTTMPFPDPFTTIAAMSSVTTTLRFMSYVYVLPLREPFSVAKQVGTTAILSDNRVVFGVGSGWLREEFEVMGLDFRTRGRRTDEMLDIIRDFWDDGWAEHHSDHYDFDRSAMFPVPSAPIPIWVGGKSDAALRRAIRQDGWLGMNYDLDEVHERLETLATMRADGGDTRADFEVFVIPNAMPSPELYADLEKRGVTSTLGGAWPPGDPTFATIEAKRAAAEHFAKEYFV
jgi:probable F420-dependent oxidoreductase